jgi:SAM-dependent methyltransferase
MPWDHKQSAKEVVRHIGLKLGAGSLLRRRRRDHGLVTTHLDRANAVDRFREIYESRAWVSSKGQLSLSGLGSETSSTRSIVEALPALLVRLRCETLLDVGCGDWNWMREVPLPCNYIGTDIVPEVIEANRRYERVGVRFEVGDAIEGPLPQADVVLCRDVLFHLSFRDGMAALANIQAAARWLLATSDTAIWFNSDIQTGDYRRINLERAPYRLPRPRAVISDEGVSRGRVVALWATAELPTDGRGRSAYRRDATIG